MTDHTIDRLAELTATAGEARSRDYGNASRVLAEHRDALAAAAEQTARAANAPIRTARAIMLLFDVLVGITTGTLAHSQEMWMIEVRRPHDGFECGTYRCVAGWLAKIAFPHLVPVSSWAQFHPGEPEPDLPVVEYYSATVDGRKRTIAEWACEALDVDGDETYPARQLFSASATLDEIWAAAGTLTGGAITVPAHLAEKVAATVDHLDDPRWVQA